MNKRDTDNSDTETGELAPLEHSQVVAEAFAEALREACDEPEETIYRSALTWLTGRVEQRAGVDSGSNVETTLRAERLERILADACREGDVEPATVLGEPHLLGWFHEHWGEPARAESHRAHNRHEQKHASAPVATQLYTPRWIADFLVERALASSSSKTEVLDPALGGGQMLLAAFDAYVRRGLEPQQALRRLRGVDLDARAVDVARRNLALHAARVHGEWREAFETIVEANLRVGDGLFDELDSADVVVTNPPYMGLRSMPEQLKAQVRESFEPFHGDLYAAFIDRCHRLADEVVGVLAQQTIWYLKRFRRAREQLMERGTLRDFAHLGPHAFRSLSGEKANVVAFVQSIDGTEAATQFVDLRDSTEPEWMRETLTAALDESGGDEPFYEGVRYERNASNFVDLPGRPVAHWLPEPLRHQFEHDRRLGDIADIPGCQLKTADNARFVRNWREVPDDERFDTPMRIEPSELDFGRREPDGARWVFYSKGGGFAPWWGNWQSVVDWSKEARDYYHDNATSNLVPERYRFREGICYTDFGGQSFNARWMPPGCLFDMAGPAIFPHDCDRPRRRLFALLALLNTSPARVLLNAMNPSIHYQVTDLRRLPLPEVSSEAVAELAESGRRLVTTARGLAGDVESSPVTGVGNNTGVEFDRTIEEASRRVEQQVGELYGWRAPELDERRRHRYLERLDEAR